MTPKIAKKTKPETKNASALGKETQFAPGQRWQLALGFAEVVHVGKILIDYRYYKVETQKHVPVETKTIVDFASTLKKNKAKLVA